MIESFTQYSLKWTLWASFCLVNLLSKTIFQTKTTLEHSNSHDTSVIANENTFVQVRNI